MPGPTLTRAPPPDPTKSVIENVLEITPLTSVAPDIFTNTSMHCYFVLAGDASIPIVYYVERVRDGRSFITRTVQARQKGKCIFTTTLSFVREGSAGKATINHGWDMPADAIAHLKTALKEQDAASDTDAEALGVQGAGPFETIRLPIENNTSSVVATKKTRQWVKARGHISSTSGPQIHLSALAYMSDSYFIGTVARVHNLWRFSSSPFKRSNPKIKDDDLAKMEDEENTEADTRTPRASIGIMVSLDHTIYFHRPREVRADDWLLAENESPWSGDGRGLVFQRIWNREGVLVASCVQEGLVRLAQEEPSKSKL
ncbi:MAG: hypothetical protein Q9208_003151 [Pyrenodesmia sp. 3 TL-2023]